MNSLDNLVVSDAINQLKTAIKILNRLVKTTACTQEYEAKLVSEAVANIDAARARLV